MSTSSIPATTISVSRHAIERARERLGWSAHALRRMADRVLGLGFAPDDLAGSMHRYMAEQEAVEGAVVRSYGEHLFVFQQRQATGELMLITVWELPGDLRVLLRRARRRLNAG